MPGVAKQYSELITGDKDVLNTLRFLIASRVMCKMEIPSTHESWIALLLEIRDIGDTYHLLIDNVAGFKAALSKIPDKEVSLEFAEKGGVPCWFNTRIIECNPREIVSELPRVIYRIQRRQYFRIEAPLGTEITFLTESSKERKKAKVKNYSAGGVSFFIENDRKLNVGDWLTEIHLNVPEGKGMIRFQIPKAAVKRVESESSNSREALCAIEFTEIPAQTRNHIFCHALKQQRVGIQRTGT